MKKKGNISILVIFILLASSLLGILSMNFVQQMVKSSFVFHSYYKAYYLAKAGIELGLTQIQHRGIGFEYIVYTGDTIVHDNFAPLHSFSLSMHTSGTASLLSKKFWQDTTCQFPYVLSSGQSLIIPLITEEPLGSVYETFQPGITYKNLGIRFAQDQISFIPDNLGEVTFGILILSGNDLSSNGIFFKTGMLTQGGLLSFKQEFETYLDTIDPTLYPLESQWKNNYRLSSFLTDGFSMYFMISNSTAIEKSFCVSVGQPITPTPGQINILPTDTFFLQSQASYDNQNVALDASYAQPIPGFLFNTYTTY